MATRGVVEASASTRISLMWTVEARSQELSFLEACPGQSKLTVLLPGATKGRASAGNGRGILGQKALHPEPACFALYGNRATVRDGNADQPPVTRRWREAAGRTSMRCRSSSRRSACRWSRLCCLSVRR